MKVPTGFATSLGRTALGTLWAPRLPALAAARFSSAPPSPSKALADRLADPSLLRTEAFIDGKWVQPASGQTFKVRTSWRRSFGREELPPPPRAPPRLLSEIALLSHCVTRRVVSQNTTLRDTRTLRFLRPGGGPVVG